MKTLVVLAGTFFLALAIWGCGGGDGEGGYDSCPGVVCTNCAGGGDCDQLLSSCPSGQVIYCGHFGWFSDPGLRCQFCEAPDAVL